MDSPSCNFFFVVFVCLVLFLFSLLITSNKLSIEVRHKRMWFYCCYVRYSSPHLERLQKSEHSLISCLSDVCCCKVTSSHGWVASRKERRSWFLTCLTEESQDRWARLTLESGWRQEKNQSMNKYCQSQPWFVVNSFQISLSDLITD